MMILDKFDYISDMILKVFGFSFHRYEDKYKCITSMNIKYRRKYVMNKIIFFLYGRIYHIYVDVNVDFYQDFFIYPKFVDVYEQNLKKSAFTSTYIW